MEVEKRDNTNNDNNNKKREKSVILKFTDSIDI